MANAPPPKSDGPVSEEPIHVNTIFTFEESLRPWAVPAKGYLAKHNRPWHGLAGGNVVFDATGRRVLLIQRASHDSMPNRWEIPGGAVDDEDASILHGAARELREEAGLTAVHYHSAVTVNAESGSLEHVFTNRTGTVTWCAFIFVAEVRWPEDVSENDRSVPVVTLDPNEHQDFVWAMEEEVRDQRMQSGRAIPFTTPEVQGIVLNAFKAQSGMIR